MVRNGEREREMKTDSGWIERGQMGCSAVGVSGAGRGKEKGGRWREVEVVEVSSGSVVAVPWLRSDVRVHFPGDTRACRHDAYFFVPFVLFRLVSSRISAFSRSPALIAAVGV